MRNLLLLCCLTASLFSFGQQGILPSQVYDEGEEVYSPTYGIKLKIPAGWVGMLPRNTEVFLLSSKKGIDAQIYLFADSTSLLQLKERWATGLTIDEGRVIKSDGKIDNVNGIISSNVVLTGVQHTGHSGYIEARCGNYGTCVAAMLSCQDKYLAEVKSTVSALMQQLTFVEPSMKKEYEGFDWKLFLSNKQLIHYGSVVGSKSENEIWLCQDGTFLAKLKRTGNVQGELGSYKGKHKGTWESSSFGKNGSLLLKFDKLPEVTVDLLIEDERIFLNEKSYLVVNAAMCN
jgi:hypothetical protein